MYKSHSIINAKKILLLILLLLPITGWSAAPCSGKKAGISHCNGSQFVCNDGSTSKSTKDCSSFFNGEQQQTQAVVTTTIINPNSIAQGNVEITRSGNILKLDYPGFTLWLDCSKRGAIKFQYVAQRDNGNYKRYDKFFLDPNVPAECQQKTANAYGHDDGHDYDRGHQLCNLYKCCSHKYSLWNGSSDRKQQI